MLGGLAYLVTGLSKLGRIEPLQARLHGPGFDWEGDFIALGIGNGRQAGGGQALCPDALDRRRLARRDHRAPLEGDLLATVGTAGRGQGCRAGSGRDSLCVAVGRRGPPTEPLTLNLDGEPVEATRFRIECMSGRLRMHLPADCPLRGNAAKVAA
jgi:diacylglycerol kinase family enzyme